MYNEVHAVHKLRHVWEIKHTIRKNIEWATFWYINQDHGMHVCKYMVKREKEKKKQRANGPRVTPSLNTNSLFVVHCNLGYFSPPLHIIIVIITWVILCQIFPKLVQCRAALTNFRNMPWKPSSIHLRGGVHINVFC